MIDRLLAAFTKLGLVFQNPFPSLHPFDLLVGAAAAVLLRLVVWSKIKNAKKYRHGEEYGTARWGNEKDIAPFINSDFSQNILLTDTERLTLGKIADPEKRNVNLNVLVIGGSGSGKTRYHIKPNLLQMNASYVCSDPKGTVVEEVGRALVQQGHYTIAGEVGKTPEQWNSGVFSMIHSLSESVIVPIAGLVIAAVLSYELIRMVIDKNNMHDFDTFIFFKWIIKAGIAAYVVSHTFDFSISQQA